MMNDQAWIVWWLSLGISLMIPTPYNEERKQNMTRTTHVILGLVTWGLGFWATYHALTLLKIWITK
jgi:hypothetical protein